MLTVIALAALLILILVLEGVLNKRGRNADGNVTPYESGDSSPADGTTAHPVTGHHAHHSATDAGGHSDGGFSGHGGFDGGGFGGHGH